MKARKLVTERSTAGSKGNATRAEQLLKAITISAGVIKESKSLNRDQKHTLFDGLEQMRELIAATAPSKSVKGLAYIEQAVVQPWNESVDEDAEKFWQAAADAGLTYARRNVLRDVLARKRIKSRPEYEVVVDTVDADIDSGQITADEAAALRKMVAAFERSH